MTNEILKSVASINTRKIIGDTYGIDSKDYVFDIKMIDPKYPQGSAIWLILHPKDKPSYARSLYNEIIGKNRTGGFEVEKASVYAMIPDEKFVDFVTEGMEADGFKFSMKCGMNLPFPLFDHDHVIIEKHLENINSSDGIIKSVEYLDEALKRMQ